MSKIIIANWKLNPKTSEEAAKLAVDSDIAGLVICPPDDFLEVVSQKITLATLGAQDLVSAEKLKSLNVQYVIIGHSDRRKLGETDEMVAKKIKLAVENGLIPILCVGESRVERIVGQTKDVVARELKIGLSLLNPIPYTPNPIIIAYEPIWAIGTGNPDTPENAIEMVQFIRKTLNANRYTLNAIVIYGGSVTSKNTEDFLKHPEIEGALVGGASLDAEEIKKIVAIANSYR